jgi:hypothetical protein
VDALWGGTQEKIMSKRRTAVAILLGLFALSAISVTNAQPSQTAQIGSCSVFPPDNPWNRDVSRDPVHPRSNAYISSLMQGPNKTLRAGFGLWSQYGIPYAIVSGSQPKVPIRFTEWGMQSDPGPYPIPLNAPVEGAGTVSSDQHVLVVDKDNCKLYEMHNASRSGSAWQASSGAVFDLRSNALRPERWTSADAAGLPIFPGLVRYDEVVNGAIAHALRVTVWRAQAKYVYPARHFQNNFTDPNLPPMGLRIRLKASFNTAGYSSHARVILEALKKYGMMVADVGQNFHLSGTSDSRWDRASLETLRNVPITAFEAVVIPGMEEYRSPSPTVPAPANTPIPINPGTDGASDMRVQYRVMDTSPVNNIISPSLQIINSTDRNIALKDIRLRYWFTRDKNAPLVFTCSSAAVGCNNVWGFFVELTNPPPSANTYLEVAFSQYAGTVPARGSSGPLQVRINRSDWSTFEQRNDYSFDATKTWFVDWHRVTLHYQGKQIWGASPYAVTSNTSSAEAAPTFVPKP